MFLSSNHDWFGTSLWQKRIQSNFSNFALKNIYYIFCITVGHIITKYSFEKFIFEPIGHYFGLTHRKIKVQENPILEKAFTSNRDIDYNKITDLAKNLDWSERKLQTWIRKRIYRDKPSTLKKFAESGWKLTYHVMIVLCGVFALHDDPCLWDSDECFKDYTKYEITSKLWWHYMLAFGHYTSQLLFHFKGTRRKDFLLLIVHHIATAALLGGSAILNIYQVGSLTLLIHDLVDVFLEAGKMAKYIKKHQLSNAILFVFFGVWTVTRLIMYPYRIIYSMMTATFDPPLPEIRVIICLLCVIQFLHLYWTWNIIQMCINIITKNPEHVKDVRSDSEDFECSKSTDDKEN